MLMAMDRKTARLESQLCKAVKDGDPRTVQLLLSQGASPDLVGSKGVAAMHLAVGKETEKNTRCLKMLLQHGANPNIRSSDGLTPLHVAALWGCYQNLKLLLINGGNPNIKDNEGNTPKQLAEQQENQKCAHLLQEYQISSVETEEDDLPQFQYSVYSEHTDTSSYPESDYSFSSHSSMISEFGEAPMSSTRCSSFFNLSNINGRPSWREMPYDRISGQSILSSTRMSAVGPAVAMTILKEDDSYTDDGMVTSGANKHSAANDNRVSPSRRDTLPAFFSRPTIRKSVSFRDVDEYFPVFSPESPKKDPAVDDSHPGSHLAFDMTEYPDFLHSERMATVLHKQGIDVTSPDHVYVFCRVSSSSTEEDLDKTVMSRCAFDEQETRNVKADQGNIPEHQAHFTVGSSGSGTGSSHYSSCESDHYTSALEASVHPRHHLLPAVEEVSAGTGTDRMTQISTDSEAEFTRLDGNFPPVQKEPKVDIECDTKESLPGMLEKMNLSEAKHTSNNVLEACSGPVVDISSNRGVDKPEADTRSEEIAALEEKGEVSFTPSPFVTGRTRSRLSRCSLRTSRTPESIFSTSALFEETLPTPVRTRRQTPRSQSYKDFHGLTPALSHLPSHSAGSSTEGDSLPVDCEDTQSSTLGAISSVNDSQADTFILSKKVTDSAGESQTLCDTVVLEKNQDTSVDAYERNLAEIPYLHQDPRSVVA